MEKIIINALNEFYEFSKTMTFANIWTVVAIITSIIVLKGKKVNFDE